MVTVTSTTTLAVQTLRTTVASDRTWQAPATTVLTNGLYDVVASVTNPSGGSSSASQALTVDNPNQSAPVSTGPTGGSVGTPVGPTPTSSPVSTGPTGGSAGTPAPTAAPSPSSVPTVVPVNVVPVNVVPVIVEPVVVAPVTDQPVIGTPVVAPVAGTPSNTTPAQTVQPGGTVLVTGSNFGPRQPVAVLLDGTGIPLGTLITDDQGNLSGALRVPGNAELGTHRVGLVGHVGAPFMSQPIIVTMGYQTDWNIRMNQLPHTGMADAAEVAALGMSFVTLGALALLLGRRPRRLSQAR